MATRELNEAIEKAAKILIGNVRSLSIESVGIKALIGNSNWRGLMDAADELAHALAARPATGGEGLRAQRCPSCDSPSPERHPAMQFEGEVQVCPDPWHAFGEGLRYASAGGEARTPLEATLEKLISKAEGFVNLVAGRDHNVRLEAFQLIRNDIAEAKAALRSVAPAPTPAETPMCAAPTLDYGRQYVCRLLRGHSGPHRASFTSLVAPAPTPWQRCNDCPAPHTCDNARSCLAGSVKAYEAEKGAPVAPAEGARPTYCDDCPDDAIRERNDEESGRCVECGRLHRKQHLVGGDIPWYWVQAEPAAAPRPAGEPRPKIICLCGSTKFIETFAVKTWELELEGNIVLGCTLLPSWYCPVRDHFAETMGVKEQRDNHHLQKIDLADEVLVLNVGGYIGESTRNEIAYATAHGKPVNYLEALPPSDTRGQEDR